jgi:hypothetical protein
MVRISSDERRFLRTVAIALAVVYVAVVGILSLVKADFELEGMPWSEVVYGPAISTASIYVLCLGSIAMNHWTRSRTTGK